LNFCVIISFWTVYFIDEYVRWHDVFWQLLKTSQTSKIPKQVM
jgi:hypothetical protein